MEITDYLMRTMAEKKHTRNNMSENEAATRVVSTFAVITETLFSTVFWIQPTNIGGSGGRAGPDRLFPFSPFGSFQGIFCAVPNSLNT